MTTLPPAPRPCVSCPYRQDVPAGVWSATEYAKLPLYDAPTYEQPTGLFLCHQHDRDDERARVCAGWAGCHDGDHLMALRMAAVSRKITPETAQAIADYVSPVPLFATGEEAARHGMSGIDDPGPEAAVLIAKIRRTRNDLREVDT